MDPEEAPLTVHILEGGDYATTNDAKDGSWLLLEEEAVMRVEGEGEGNEMDTN